MKMSFKIDFLTLLPIITLMIGAILGALSNLLIESYRQTQNISEKIIEQHFKIRQEICDEICLLANLQIENMPDRDTLLFIRNNISKLFFKYYDFLPKPVLQELNCLYACLTDKNNRIFFIRNNEISILEEADLESFIKNISLVDNFKYFALISLRSDNVDLRRSASINYQARNVLVAINEHLNIRELLRWSKDLRK